MNNLYYESLNLLKKYNLTIDDVIVCVNGKTLKTKREIKEKLNFDYDEKSGQVNFKNIQLILDDYTWFERTSYDGYEKFILKAHPLLSKFTNQESHTQYFY